MRWSLRASFILLLSVLLGLLPTSPARSEGDWETTGGSEQALERGLRWLAANQGPRGNWESDDLGLVALGALAFLSAGHAPGRGRYGRVVERSLDYVIDNAKPSGVLNIANSQRDMYNHGLATFVLGQAHGMTTDRDGKLDAVLGRALKLISDTQCEDGGWDYKAYRQLQGHDLSLAVMQAKALRSAMDSGLEVPPDVVEMAIKSVREHYCPRHGNRDVPESQQRLVPGQFTYGKGGGGGTVAMAAAGVVCMQEFGQYDDWRIPKNMEVIDAAIADLPGPRDESGSLPFDAYTLYYVGQALYQVDGTHWEKGYPRLRDHLVATQVVAPGNSAFDGQWHDRGARGGNRVQGKPGDLFGTAVACFVLAIPNRYLPILQEGRIERFRDGP